MRTIDAIGIRHLLDGCVISEVEDLTKPDARIFRLAASRLGTPPGECAFVGDHPVSDVGGAAAAGMFPIWKRVSYWKEPDSVAAISQMDELEAKLFPEKPPAA